MANVEKTKFQELLDEVDMSGAQLARRLKITRTAVSAWGTGKSAPKWEKVPEIAKALNVSVERVSACFY